MIAILFMRIRLKRAYALYHEALHELFLLRRDKRFLMGTSEERAAMREEVNSPVPIDAWDS